MGFRQGQCLRMSKAARLAKAPPKEWPTANTNTNTNDNDNDTSVLMMQQQQREQLLGQMASSSVSLVVQGS